MFIYTELYINRYKGDEFSAYPRVTYSETNKKHVFMKKKTIAKATIR